MNLPIELPEVTLCIIDCKEYSGAVTALNKSLKQIKPARAIFLTNIRTANPRFNFEFIFITPIKSKDEYSRFVMKELYKYITTDYVLIIQADGWILDGSQWDERFLEYDYIGAPWPFEDKKHNVGNGGFSLRSKKLLEATTDNKINATHMEDAQICRSYREFLEYNYDIKYAPEEIAEKFAFELAEPVNPTFGFHGNFHKPYQPTVIITRNAALGDIIMTEPVFEYYHKKGYHVVLDAPIHFAMVFAQHDLGKYPIKHISQVDKRVADKALKINLDMSYENDPKRNHLECYFRTAGIEDYVLRNPQLHFTIGDHNRLFEKYIVISFDQRDTPSRNVVGFDDQISAIATELHEDGYTVIRVGHKKNVEYSNVIWMNTLPSVNMLMYVMAGASAFIGTDSGAAAVAVSLNIPSVIFTGSVDLRLIWPDMKNILWIRQNHNLIEGCKPMCWHNSEGSTTGVPCVIDKDAPPCCDFSDFEIDSIMDFIKEKTNS